MWLSFDGFLIILSIILFKKLNLVRLWWHLNNAETQSQLSLAHIQNFVLSRKIYKKK